MKKYLDIIKSSVERGNSVTSRMLTFTRSEQPEIRPLSLIEFIHEIRDIAEHTLPKNINIRTTKYHGHDYVSADPNQLQQVLISLSINAADSMPKGGNIELGIRRAYRHEQEQHAVDTEKDYLCIVISDTGTGMEKSIQERIFEPFFTTKERTKGTGLGLSVAYTIINRHSGWIHVDSKKDVGSTFVIGLPVTEPEDLIQDQDTESGRLPPGGNGELILVVEDELALQSLVVEILESHGYRVQVANNSLQALDLFSENPNKFDLVLTDLGLPQMSGEELIEHLRVLNPDVPIVAATGYINEERHENILKQGVTALIQKPFSLQHLLKTFYQVFYQ
ncbi:MAG: response regulator [Candidatus Marinimicrobia bacterium]|nr:response regulator [Candidatus Neomarinimicrobiota bacterium]